MRIGLISRRFDPDGGGTERDLIITARILADAGHHVRFFAGEIRGERCEDLEVTQVKTGGIGRAMRLRSFANNAAVSARQARMDLVFSFGRILDADILRSGGSAHSSYIAAARQWQSRSAALAMALSPYHRMQVMIERRGFASARLKRSIAVSELVRADLVKSFALDPATVVTLYNGVDLDRFRPDASGALREQVRRELHLSEAAALVAFVGNGFARKGLGFLIEGWREVTPAAHLVVAGSDRALPHYRRLAHRSSVADRVHFLGPQPHIERLFAAVDAFALPSLFEPFGNVVMEAMAAGLPALCTKACGAAEAFDPSMRELIVSDPTDVASLSRGVNELLRVRGDLRGIARQTAERFTWDAYGANLLKLIADL